MAYVPVEELEGEELDFSENPTPDDNIDAVILFAGDEDDAFLKAEEWKELFNGL